MSALKTKRKNDTTIKVVKKHKVTLATPDDEDVEHIDESLIEEGTSNIRLDVPNEEIELKKPFTVTPNLTWSHVVHNSNIIPMNQRQYEWKEKELGKFMDDLQQLFLQKRYWGKMGNLIVYQNAGVNEIYDGQQRSITVMLLVFILIQMEAEELDDERPYMFMKRPAKHSTLDKLKNNFCKRFDFDTEKTKFCNIFCINDFDQLALTLIFNNLYITSYKHLLLTSGESYLCKHCYDEEKKVYVRCKRASDFIRHLGRCGAVFHSDKNPPEKVKDIAKQLFQNTVIFDAYDYLYKRMVEWKGLNSKMVLDFHRYLLNYVDISIMQSNDLYYVSKIFEYENNRGTMVKPLDIIKNNILRLMSYEDKVEVYEKWNKYIKMESPNAIYDNYGIFLFRCAIQIYNIDQPGWNKEMYHRDLIDAFQPLLAKDKLLDEVNKFFKIIEKCHKHMTQIMVNDRYGRLLSTNSHMVIPLSMYQLLLLPVFHLIQNIDTKLVEMIVKTLFRSMCTKKITLSNFSGRDMCESVVRSIHSDKTFDYKKAISDYFESHHKIEKDYFINWLAKANDLKRYELTYLLYLVETCLTADNNTVALNNTLEHIICESKAKTLNDPKNINCIGNLTILEGKNSSNGQQGNFSLKNKPYVDKREQYKMSCTFCTKAVAETYKTFDEQTILDRSKVLAEMLDKFTNVVDLIKKPTVM